MNLSIGQQQSLAFAVRVVAEVSGLRARQWSEFGFARRRFPTGPWLGFARATDAPARIVSTDREEVGPHTPATQKSCIMTRITAGRGDCPDRKRRGRGRCSDIESGYYGPQFLACGLFRRQETRKPTTNPEVNATATAFRGLRRIW